MSSISIRPETRYAARPEGYVAYQVFGSGSLDLVFRTSWATNMDAMWDEPSLVAYMQRLASFARVICYDKRGSGVSDPVPLASLPTIEDWTGDALTVMDHVGVERAAILGDTEGGPMAAVLAASHPDRVQALALVNTYARWRRAPDYPIGMPDETTEKLLERYAHHWGVTSEILDFTAPSVANDPRFRSWWLTFSRLTMPRHAAATMYRWVTSVDIRSILPSIRVPTLVVQRSGSRHHRVEFGRYLAENIPNAKYVELPGADSFPFHAGDFKPVLDEVEGFLTGTQSKPVLNRRLATLLFTDIVGSTRIVAERGDNAWIDLVRAHDEIVRQQLRSYRGEEVDRTGDGFLAVFDAPARAVTCAARVVESLRDQGITIRAGLHTGEVQLEASGVRGVAVHVASRVMGAAGDGGILVSRTVKELVLGSGIDFADRGTHALRDVPGEWELFEVVSAP
jgi:class 3 adenylate cyclase/pimeloyl-ACP methyl ester carboxylesterase